MPRHSTIPEADRAGLQGEVSEVTPTVCPYPVDSSPPLPGRPLPAGRALPESHAAEPTVGFTAVVTGVVRMPVNRGLSTSRSD